MEVMIGMIIFLMLIGLTGKLVSTTSNYPFVSHPVESWLNYIERINTEVQQLSDNSNLLNPGVFFDPFPNMDQPSDLIQLKMMVGIENGNSDLKIIQFYGTTTLGKTYEWRIYRQHN